MQRIRVDLPEPDGPSTTITSRSFTVRSTPWRAWKSPNHFLTPRQVIMLSRAAISALRAMLASDMLMLGVSVCIECEQKDGESVVMSASCTHAEAFLEAAGGT